jgi:hypothetical protein
VPLLWSVSQVDTVTLRETFHEIVIHRSQSSSPEERCGGETVHVRNAGRGAAPANSTVPVNT